MICIDNISVRSESFTLSSISFEIEKGECLALMGKSGSGKSTIMEAICGLREVIRGSINIDGEELTYAAPRDRMVGLVPQDNVLFPTMTVREHLAYGPRLRKWKKPEINSRIEEVAAELGITSLLDRLPRGLSGGEAKRVAIGRAIAAKPSLLCLDESFTGLDDETLTEVMAVVKSTIQRENISTLLITHQMKEAQILGDDIYRIQEDGSVTPVDHTA
ncbi:MAG: molybdate/tungstate transport system ATP-binding protein [Cryomorphaceae bacterium]|jgi:molybdate/tungstate transport system ATP-binding protein